MDRVSAFMHVYTLYSAVRPFGCSLMYGSYSAAEGPQLYMADPSGVSWVSLVMPHGWVELHAMALLTLCRDTMLVLWAKPSRQPRQSWRS